MYLWSRAQPWIKRGGHGGSWVESISRNAAHVSGITGSAEMAKQYTLDLATSYFLSLSNQKKIKSTCLINLAMKYATTI